MATATLTKAKAEATSGLDPSNGKTQVTVAAPRISTAIFNVVGTSPLVLHHFSEKTRHKMEETHKAGSQARGKKVREARDFEADYEGAKYIAEKGGWCGIPAGAFRTAMIDVCRLTSVKMTFAKLSIFIEQDGFDKTSGTPIVRINGDAENHIAAVRNASGVTDLRARPMWRKWSVALKVRFDEDQFSLADVTNLLSRVGIQCGIGEGRHNSKASTGCGFGCFTLQGSATA